MPVAEPDKGRVVVVAAGFALWIGGKCAAAGRWIDVARLSASLNPAGALVIRVELTDGGLLELDEGAPGFDLFLDRAAQVLHGLQPFKSWHHSLTAGGAAVTIFDRRDDKRGLP